MLGSLLIDGVLSQNFGRLDESLLLALELREETFTSREHSSSSGLCSAKLYSV